MRHGTRAPAGSAGPPPAAPVLAAARQPLASAGPECAAPPPPARRTCWAGPGEHGRCDEAPPAESRRSLRSQKAARLQRLRRSRSQRAGEQSHSARATVPRRRLRAVSVPPPSLCRRQPGYGARQRHQDDSQPPVGVAGGRVSICDERARVQQKQFRLLTLVLPRAPICVFGARAPQPASPRPPRALPARGGEKTIRGTRKVTWQRSERACVMSPAGGCSVPSAAPAPAFQARGKR
jgi:hypothetical protein